MESIERTRLLSQDNLNRLLKKISKYKPRRDHNDIEVALDSLPIYHCVRATNIIEVIKCQEIRVKNLIVQGEHTNMTTDYFQGFDQHLSMSVGRPWVEYGPFAFAYGLEHVHKDSLAFNDDPWLWGSHRFQKNVLTKEDFVSFAREMLKRNIWLITKKIYIPIPFKVNLHWLAASSFRNWEIKQAASLNVMDAEELFVWNNMDEFIFKFNRLLGNPVILTMLVIAAGLMLLRMAI